MSQDASHGSPPLRCMANYYDLGPQHPASSGQARRPEPVPQRSIPGRMANYEDPLPNPLPADYQELRSSSRQRNEIRPPQRSLLLEDAPETSLLQQFRCDLNRPDTVITRHSTDSSRYTTEIHKRPVENVKQQVLATSARSSIETQDDSEDRKRPWQTIIEAMQSADSNYKHKIRGSRLYGWRMGVLFGACVSSFVLVCNIAMIIIGARTRLGYDRDGVATLLEGDETTVSRWNTIGHIFINVLSTVLLSASNYTMQVLNAPTRTEMDRAHACGKWLDVGLLSVHNLRIISPKRAALCLILAVSSLPLHLFYNAAVFKIITMSDYNVVLVHSTSTQLNGTNGLRGHWNDSVQLDNARWKTIYNEPEVSRYGDLYLVIDQISYGPNVVNTNFSLYEGFPVNLTSNTFISLDKPLGEGWANFTDWTPRRSPYDQTGAENIHFVEGWTTDSGRNSRIQISLYFMIVVLCFNFFKLAIMIGVLTTDTSEYVVTLGDAAASYLQRPEDLTKGRSTLELDQMLLSFDIRYATDDEKYTWQPRRRRYCSSIGYDKAWSAIIAGTCLVIVLAVFPTRINGLDSGLWQWGSASTGSLSFGARGASAKATIWNAWLSNMPQVLLSLCYLNLNTICTSMASTAEWNTLATSRKGLRVTKPHGDQRSTYFLQLPYRWAAPLMTISGGLHWLLSQTFFLSRIDHYSSDGNLQSWTSACGISFLSLVTFCVVCLLLIVAVRWIGRRPMMTNLPLAENCSLMISAACHAAVHEVDPHLAKVRWGAVPDTGRCSLSSKHVKRPQVGEFYG